MVLSAATSPGLNLWWAGNTLALTSLLRECMKKWIQDKKKIIWGENLWSVVHSLCGSQLPWEPPRNYLKAWENTYRVETMVEIQFSQEVHLWSLRTPHWVSSDPTCNMISNYLCECTCPQIGKSGKEWKPKKHKKQGLKVRLKYWEEQSSFETQKIKCEKGLWNYQRQPPFNGRKWGPEY